MSIVLQWKVVGVVYLVGISCQLIPSQLGVQYTKVLECGSIEKGDSINLLNVTIETHVQSAGISQFWPPIERQSGNSLITAEYQYVVNVSASQNLSAQLVFFDVQCEDILDSSSPQFAQQLESSPQQSQQVGQYLIQEIIDQERVASSAIVGSSGVQSCCNLVPEFPEFPSEFSVTIEANMADKGYSMFQQEYYSGSRNLFRVDTYTAAGNKIIIQDFNQQQQFTLLLANQTYPNGLCQQQTMQQSQLVGTLAFIFLEDDVRSEATFVPSTNPIIIRGVPCEQWTYNIQGYGNNTMGINGTYTVDVYFAFASWHVSRSHQHRQLMRIRVRGLSYALGGSSIDHYYEYVDFIPSVPEDKSFQACKIIPSGEGCGCSLADKQGLTPVSILPPEERMTVTGVACLFPFVYKQSIHTDCVKIGQKEVCPDESGVWQECQFIEGHSIEAQQPTCNQSLKSQQPIIQSSQVVEQTSSKTKDFTSSQAVNYVICGLIGLVVGVLVTGMGTYVYIKKRRLSPSYGLYDINEMELTNGGASKIVNT